MPFASLFKHHAETLHDSDGALVGGIRSGNHPLHRATLEAVAKDFHGRFGYEPLAPLFRQNAIKNFDLITVFKFAVTAKTDQIGSLFGHLDGKKA